MISISLVLRIFSVETLFWHFSYIFVFLLLWYVQSLFCFSICFSFSSVNVSKNTSNLNKIGMFFCCFDFQVNWGKKCHVGVVCVFFFLSLSNDLPIDKMALFYFESPMSFIRTFVPHTQYWRIHMIMCFVSFGCCCFFSFCSFAIVMEEWKFFYQNKYKVFGYKILFHLQ